MEVCDETSLKYNVIVIVIVVTITNDAGQLHSVTLMIILHALYVN
jgi:hypothetical protein